MELLTTTDERLLMETRPGDPTHGEFARGWETLAGSHGRKCQLIRQYDGLRPRTLEVRFLEFGAGGYSFTFGWSGDGDG
jgi:hypothetical protein